MAKKGTMTEDEIQSVASSMIRDSLSYDWSDRAKHREWALRFERGEIDIPQMAPDRSSFVSRDVADTIGLILPGLLRTFFASDRIAVYEPTRPEHEEYSEDATDYVNYIVLKECAGYRVFRDAFYEGLLLGNGIVKHWWDDTPEVKVDDYTGLTDEEYAFITSQPKSEVTAHKAYDDPDWQQPEIPPELEQAAMAGNPQAVQILEQLTTPPKLHDFTLKRTLSSGRLRVASVPDEEFMIDKTAVVLDETTRFVAHVKRVTRSSLIEEGFDKDTVDALPSYEMPLDKRQDRQQIDFEGVKIDKAPDQSTELVLRHECYILMDVNGDGIAERVRVIMAGAGDGGKLLSWEEWGDDLPFSDIVPMPRSHAWKGGDIYDEVRDVQRIKSISIRAILDNLYEILNPQRDVVADAYLNPDAIMDRQLGAILWRKEGKEPVKDYSVESIADKVMPLLDYFDNVVEKRTGISQRSAALDMDALQNQTATAINAQQSAVHSKIEEIARNIAECGGMQRIFRCILRLVVKHQDDAKMIRLKGKPVTMDPRAWDADMHVTINVGLGSGSRDRDLQMLQGIAAKQEGLLQQFGPFNEYLNIGHLLDTYRKMAEAAGLRNAETFFPDVSEEQIAQIREQQANKPPQPDPSVQIEQAKLQAKQQADQAQLELDRQKAQQDAILAKQKLNAEMALKRQIAQSQIDLEQQKQALELAHKQKIAELDAQLKIKEMELEAQLTQQANEMKLRFSRTADVNIGEQSV